jgi:hypothetical protein
MYITFNYLNTCNIDDTEGFGSQYHKIITLYAVACKYNMKYIHIPIQIGHNYNNDKDWNNKWDIMFNFKKLSYNHEIDIETIDKEFSTDGYPLELVIQQNNHNKLYFYFHTFDIFNKQPEFFFKDIQDDIIAAYDESNYNRTLIYNKNKINIAIHIRVYNDYDIVCENINSFLESDRKKSERYYFTCEMYEKLIVELKHKYPNSDIHIFSQEKYFDIKFLKLRQIENINIHFDDLNLFDTFHHLCKSDILVMGLSSLSIVAGFYNKNTVIYLPYSFPPVLKSWIIYNDKLGL